MKKNNQRAFVRACGALAFISMMIAYPKFGVAMIGLGIAIAFFIMLYLMFGGEL